MTKTEFVERTGFEPTADEYATIEHMYYEFDGNPHSAGAGQYS